MAIHGALFDEVQVQPGAAVTPTLPGPPPTVNDAPGAPSDKAGHVTVNVNVVDVVAPQLSVAVTVMMCAPTGPAFETETVPFAAFTDSVPVNVDDDTSIKVTVPLSDGAAEETTAVLPAKTTLAAE